jgi:hypothetical protein
VHLLYRSKRSQQKVKKGRQKRNALLETIRERKETKTRLKQKDVWLCRLWDKGTYRQ